MGKVRDILSHEPVLAAGFAVAVVVFVAGQLHVVLNPDDVGAVVAPIVAAVIGRPFVYPASKVEPAGEVPADTPESA